MKNLLIALFIILSSISVFGQDKKANSTLDKVSKKYKSFTSIKSTFSVTTKNKIDKSTKVEKGTIFLKNDKFKVDFGGQEIYCDGKTIWTYMKDANEVQIEKFMPKSNTFNPAEIFTIYQKGFLYKHAGNTTVGGKVIENIELTPKDKKKPFFKVKLMIEQSTSQIKSAEFMFKNGQTATYEISTFVTNAAMDNSIFTFVPSSKPGIEINDLR